MLDLRLKAAYRKGHCRTATCGTCSRKSRATTRPVCESEAGDHPGYHDTESTKLGKEEITPGDVGQCTGTDVASKLACSVLRTLTPVVAFDWLCVGTTDPASGSITAMHCEKPGDLPERCVESELFAPDVGNVAALARERDPIALLSSATGGNPETSRRYRRLLKPNRIEHELRAALVVDGLCWGFVTLLRSRDQPNFATSDVARLRAVLPELALELRQSLLAGPIDGPRTGSTGVIVVGPENSLHGLNARAGELLERIPALRPTVGEGLPIPVAAVVASLGNGAELDALRILVAGSSGGCWLALSGSRVYTRDGHHHIVVELDFAERADITPLLFQSWGLTARESAVAQQVLSGLSTVEVAASLGISRHTVQDHLKAVFAKTGVHSRREFARMVLPNPQNSRDGGFPRATLGSGPSFRDSD